MQPFWTEHRLNELKRLAQIPHLSAIEIGNLLGCSKNAVCGKANREGIGVNSNYRRAPRHFKRPCDKKKEVEIKIAWHNKHLARLRGTLRKLDRQLAQ